MRSEKLFIVVPLFSIRLISIVEISYAVSEVNKRPEQKILGIDGEANLTSKFE